ncbi:MAG: plasmid stability protein [Candidatus Eisenbacteria bacterium]|nr:plasmid stability protein [Candidatus Eisenbacteria bacterium]
MASLTIKGLPDLLLRHLSRRAEVHRRSLNSDVIHCLERAVELASIDPERWIVETEQLRATLALRLPTESTLRRAKGHGRP